MKPLSLLLGAAIISVNCYAQKLSNTQQISLRTPANIKIDGKATEWDNKFKAQNSATDLLYTISNDDDNLYFTAQTKLKDVMDKIIRGGITLNVNPTLNKKSDKQVSVSYPCIESDEASKIAFLFARVVYPEANAGREPFSWDDLNKALMAKSKIVKIAGLKSAIIEDISIYNDSGIQVASQFDDHGYTYELVIPLKYLSLDNNYKSPFSYQVKVNKQEIKPFSGVGKLPAPVLMDNIVTTDFWGEYTLAK